MPQAFGVFAPFLTDADSRNMDPSPELCRGIGHVVERNRAMKSLIVCASKSHGNTRRVADRMAEVLGAEVVTPESVDPASLRQYDLVGFGSGIYYMTVDPRLRDLLRRLSTADHTRAFTFFTSGAREIPLRGYHKPVRKWLESKGFEVIGSFSCRGWDTIGPFGFIGGINRGRPDDHDLQRAAAFASRIRKQVGGQSNAVAG